MTARLSRLLWSAAVCVLLGSSALAQQTATPALITQKIDETQRTTFTSSVSPLVKKANDLGALSTSQPLSRMVLMLKRSDAQQKALDALVAAQQQKSSDQFHKWLKPAEFQARFSPASADVAKVTGWLQSRGFSGVTASRDGQRIEFSGTVANVESAFGTSMHKFQLKTATGTEAHVANATPVSIPQALSPVVSGLVSLNNFTSHPLHTNPVIAARNAQGKFVPVKGQTTGTDGNGDYSFVLSPNDVRTIYGATSLPAGSDGTGVSIAVIGRSNVSLADIQSFRKIFSLPENDPNIIISGPDPGPTFNNDQVESSLDIEWASSIAQNATINFVIASSTDTTDGVDLATAYAIENVISPILTLSYGQCEQHLGPDGNLFYRELWEQAAAEGISVFVSSGDGGAASCDADEGNSPAVNGPSVSGLASTPYNVAVGGTQFAEGSSPLQYWSPNNGADLSSALGYIPEAAWNESCDPNLAATGTNCDEGQTYYQSTGGGGGASACATGTVDGSGNVTCTAGYPKPSWQHGTGVPADGVRDVPDVSLNASASDDPYIVCVLGYCEYTQSGGKTTLIQASFAGGTSVSAPVMASIMALVEQKNGTYLGLPNATFYNLAAQQSASSCNSTSRTDTTQPSSCVFNDTTAGNNSVPGLPGYGTDSADFTTTTGYDLATGLGSVNTANLVNNWSSATNSIATSTTLTATTTTAKHGTAVPMSVAVTSSTGTPSGDFVLLTDKYGAGDQYTLGSNGTWSGNVADLPGGTYTLTARYAGDDSYAASTSSGTSLTISPEDSKPTLAVEVNNYGILAPDTTSNYLGYPLYFKGYISGVSGQGTPTGTVNVLVDGTTNVGSATLTADGGFLLSSGNVPLGTHALTVQYLGDNSFNPGTSSPVSVSVSQGESVTYPSTGGSAITAILSVSSTSVAPTGTIQMFDNGKAVSGALPVVFNGPIGEGAAQASFPYTFSPGVHVIYAAYSGDANFLPATAANGGAYERQLNVGSTGSAATTTTFRMTTNPVLPIGQIANFIVTVTPTKAISQAPTGLVSIGAVGGQSDLCDVFLTNGKGVGTCYMDGAGTYTLQATYEGDSNFAPSTSPNTISLTVPKLTPASSFTTSAAYTLPNTQVSLNQTLTGVMINTYVEQDPIGTITFTDSVNGSAAVSLGTFNVVQVNGLVGGYSGRFTLPTGINAITSTYSGNANFNPVVSTATVVVGSPDFTFTSAQPGLTLTAGTSGSATLSLTPVLNYTGSVSLACGSGVPAGSTCTVTPSSATFGAAQTATVTVSTPVPSPTSQAALRGSPLVPGSTLGVATFAFMLMFLLPGYRRRPGMLLAVFVLMLLPLAGCGSNSTPKATLLSLNSSAIKTASGSGVTLTAKLNALASNPTGSVTFKDGTATLGSAVSLSSGTATLQISTLAVGAHNITAVYSGDNHNEGSTSTAITQVITGTTTLQITATSGALVHSISLPLTLN